MRFRYYVLIGIGEVLKYREIVTNLSETPPRVIEQKNIFICTFSSNLEPLELEGLFVGGSRNFFLYEVNDEFSVSRFSKENIHEQLFGYIENGGHEVVNTKTTELNEINGRTLSSGETTSTEIVTEPQEDLSLEDKLIIAVEAEDFEKAAEIRDEIEAKLDDEATDD